MFTLPLAVSNPNLVLHAPQLPPETSSRASPTAAGDFHTITPNVIKVEKNG